VKELLSLYILGAKFNIEYLSKAFGFDRHFLVTMKNDTDFLKQSALMTYFHFSDDSDPFLVSLSEKPTAEHNAENQNEFKTIEKLTLPINVELLSSIKNSQFLILQDLIFYELDVKMGKVSLTSGSIKGNLIIKEKRSNYIKRAL
jgi:hypothetical protein